MQTRSRRQAGQLCFFMHTDGQTTQNIMPLAPSGDMCSPIVKYRDYECAVAMWPFSKLLWTLVHLTCCSISAHVSSVSENIFVPGFLSGHYQSLTHPCNGPFSRTTQVSRYQKGKTNLDFTVARDSEWQWHQLGHMQDCTLLQTDNHASTPPLSFLQAGCPSCRPTNSV